MSSIPILPKTVANAKRVAKRDDQACYVVAANRGYSITQDASAIPFAQDHYRVDPDGTVTRRVYDFIKGAYDAVDRTAAFPA